MPLSVNGEIVDDSLIRREAAAMRPRFEAMNPGLDPIEAEMELRQWAREAVIERTLLRQEAFKDPEPLAAGALDGAVREISGQPGCRAIGGDEAIRQEAETRLRLDRLLGKLLGKLSPPRRDEINEYYRRHRGEFAAPELVHAAHIVKNVGENSPEEQARAAIAQVKAELDAGAAFEELADRYSDCPGSGGDLGWFARGQMVDEFDAVVFALAPGQTSGIFRTIFGFHIARLYERRPAGMRTLEEVRGEIEGLLMREKERRALEQFVSRLKERAEVRTVRRTEA